MHMEVISIILDIGNKIKTLRKQSKLSQEDLCCDFITRTILSRIENNKMYPSIPQLEFIAKKLNVPINYFFMESFYSDNISSLVNTPTNSNSLQQWYVNNLYGNIIKLEELQPEKFNAIDDFNKHFYLGASLCKNNMFKEALKPLKKHLNLYMKSAEHVQKENVINFAYALNYLTAIMLKNKNYSKAENYLILAKKHLTIYNQSSSQINYIIHNNIGIVYNSSNQYEKNIITLEAFLQSNKTFCFLNIFSSMHLSLNIAYYNIGEYEKSIEHIKKAILLYEYIGDTTSAIESTLNHINALRYSKNFNEALFILEIFKIKVPNYAIDFHRFIVQEMILFFNTNKHSKALELSSKINLNKLSKICKANYHFILGHISFLNNNYDKAEYHLLKSQKTFINENYSHDLTILYNDLYIMSKDETYQNKSEEYAQIRGRKNIIV